MSAAELFREKNILHQLGLLDICISGIWVSQKIQNNKWKGMNLIQGLRQLSHTSLCQYRLSYGDLEWMIWVRGSNKAFRYLWQYLGFSGFLILPLGYSRI